MVKFNPLQLTMALCLLVYGVVSTLLIHFSLVYSLNGQVSSSNSSESVQQVNYVTPNRSMPCPTDQHHCFTIDEYGSQVDKFFLNDSIFRFLPGNHSLNIGLNISSINNVSFLGLPNSTIAVIVLNESVCIIWEDCRNVEINNINFSVKSDFSCMLFFKSTFVIKLRNITVLGNSHTGCSSIITKRSTVEISNSKFNGITGYSGAAIFALHSKITFVGNNYFVRNTAVSGGSIYFYYSSVVFSGISIFTGNTAEYHSRSDDTLCQKLTVSSITFFSGGAIVCDNSNFVSVAQSIKLANGSNNMSSEMSTSDSVAYSRSDINVSSCFGDDDIILYLKFYSSWKNKDYCNGREYSQDFFNICTSVDQSANLFFGHNFAYNGGSIFGKNSTIKLVGNIKFVSNSATGCGGALMLRNISIEIFGTAFLHNNSALLGGALYLVNTTVSFQSNYSHITKFCLKKRSGCGPSDHCNSSLQFFEKILFLSNSAEIEGGAVALRSTNMTLCGSILLLNNSVHYFFGGAIATVRSSIFFGINCDGIQICNTKLLFQYNSAKDRGGSIRSVDSHIWFKGYSLFCGNRASYGGAMFLDGTSKLILKPTLNLTFVNNKATIKGGVIYYDQKVTTCVHFEQPSINCFISLNISSLEDITLEFLNNSAEIGSVLYSGKLDICHRYLYRYLFDRCRQDIQHIECKKSYPMFFNVSTFFPHTTPTSLFFADAERVEFCPSDSFNEYSIPVYPGEIFYVPLVAIGPVDLEFLTVHTKISSKLLYPSDNNILLIHENQHTNISNTCTNLSYYVLATYIITTQVTVRYQLYHDNPCHSLVEGVILNVNVKPCPRGYGFQFSEKDKKCVCDKWLQSFTDACDINSLFIERKQNNFWASKGPTNENVLILHKSRCPFDFCKDQSVNITLDNPSIQCDFNRKGMLCGQCREQYSLALGTLHCLNCFKKYYNTVLVLPFALAGIALVMVILLLHLTVDVGTLNGLIFYANIVHSNREAYFQYTREITNFHAIFISWLNLDFGIETCFYDGMDIYVYSWLQFLFPFYLWFLIGAIIFMCHYSQRLSKNLGRNPVAALGTVLFLSYGKILNSIIAPLSKTELVFTLSDGSLSTRSIWLYDGSVEYFAEPKHIALGLFAILILLFAFVPYTFILLCGHRLIAYSDKCFLSWLNKIKPFLDVYYAPFKQEARYWIGLTLSARLALLLTIAINAVGSDSVNLLVITSVTAGLLSIKGRVYEHKFSDILESSFILNLCVLSVATLYFKVKNFISQPAIISLSVGISFVIFIGILFFHIYLLFESKNVWKYLANYSLFRKNWLLRKAFKIVSKEDERLSVTLNSNDQDMVTSTLVELREPLIDNDI